MAEDSTKGLALAILGVVALVAVVGLLLVFWTAKSTGQVGAGGAAYVNEGRWANDWAEDTARRAGELGQQEQWALERGTNYDASVPTQRAPVTQESLLGQTRTRSGLSGRAGYD